MYQSLRQWVIESRQGPASRTGPHIPGALAKRCDQPHAVWPLINRLNTTCYNAAQTTHVGRRIALNCVAMAVRL